MRLPILKKPLRFILILFIITVFLIIINHRNSGNETRREAGGIASIKVEKCPHTVVFILCGSVESTSAENSQSRQIHQILVFLKSIALQTRFRTIEHNMDPTTLSPNCISTLMVSDERALFDQIYSTIGSEWSPEFKRTLNMSFVPVSYPKDVEWMRTMFRPCATLRLFMPEFLPEELDSVLYLDTDFIFLQPIQHLFDKINEQGNDKVIAAMAPCLWIYGGNYSYVPYYGTSGLNAGLMMMNLTRMRQIPWARQIRTITSQYKNNITFADQDILNIYFHFHPEELTLLSCDWNFRAPNCDHTAPCNDSLINGISALHGTAASFTSNGSEPLFHHVFKAFQELRLDSELRLDTFVEDLRMRLLQVEATIESNCQKYGRFTSMVINRMQKTIGS